MKVLVITGDRRFGPGNERYELQQSEVEELAVIYWGPGALIPNVPFKKFDVITAQDPFWRGHLAWHLSWFLGGRLNIQVHTDLSAYGFFKRLFALMQLRHADTVRVVSEKIKRQVLEMVPHAKVSVLPVFIDLKRFVDIQRVPHDTKTVLWIGRFEEEKNPFGAVEIFRKIHSEQPQIRFIMLGAGSLNSEIKKQAQGLPIEFPGWRDSAAFLPTADVVLCTSWHESFGASIIEALAAGVPVVAPDVGAAREAGAVVVPYMELADAVLGVLQGGARGELKLSMPTAEEWTRRWLETL